MRFEISTRVPEAAWAALRRVVPPELEPKLQVAHRSELVQGAAVTVIAWEDMEGYEATPDVLFVRYCPLGPRGFIGIPRGLFASAREADEAAALLERHVVPRTVPLPSAPGIDWKKIGITTIAIIIVVLLAIAYGALTRS